MTEAVEIIKQVLGVIAVILWMIMLAPQVMLNFKSRSTGSLSFLTMTTFPIWTAIIAGYGLYQQNSVLLLVQSFVVGFFGAIVLSQILYYKPIKAWSLFASITFFIIVLLATGGGTVLILYLCTVGQLTEIAFE
ncbi:hypothetical protein HK096_008913 [Nowakowskiella sp. JEL0078]|nr:hypothetical protein HK096_008913 [Nowakowskiella sp. JEL0078]